jgi:glutamate-1-semialdehyde 2,1-aminomutase
LKLERSESLFESARRVIPGGVNSPVRAYRSVGGTPVHIASGKGALVVDVDGNEYVDLVMSYGPLILGHAHPAVTAAIERTARQGTTFGAPTEGELALARRIVEVLRPAVPGSGPSFEMVRLVNSGTEATMSALRLARAATGRDLMVKFNGCYHGHGDSFLVRAGSGALTLGAPDSPGVPAALAALTLVAEYNDLEGTRALLAKHKGSIACVFVEPVAGNIGCVLPARGFLEGLRALCDEHGALLVFDEVMTGFRVSPRGYLGLSSVRPDLVTLGKVIGGGLPIGAYGGRADLMSRISPAGDVYQAGTLSGNPLAVAAGLATLEATEAKGFYETLELRASELEVGLERAARDAGVAMWVGRQGSMLCPYLSSEPVTSFASVLRTDRERWKRFFHAMLARGVLLPPSPFEAWFVSSAHDAATIERVAHAARESLKAA